MTQNNNGPWLSRNGLDPSKSRNNSEAAIRVGDEEISFGDYESERDEFVRDLDYDPDYIIEVNNSAGLAEAASEHLGVEKGELEVRDSGVEGGGLSIVEKGLNGHNAEDVLVVSSTNGEELARVVEELDDPLHRQCRWEYEDVQTAVIGYDSDLPGPEPDHYMKKTNVHEG